EGACPRRAPRLAGPDRPRLAVPARRRGPAGRFPAVPDRDEDAVPRPRRSVDRGAPRARSALVRARDRQGARAGVRALVPPRRRPRRQLRPRRAVRALPGPLPRPPARVVPRRRGARAPRAELVARDRVIGSPVVNARDVDAVLQAVRFELYRENVSGALELAERAHAAHPDPRYAEQAARIRSWLTH